MKPRIYPSPDGMSRALVYPVDISLNATPDLESRVVIRSNKGETLTLVLLCLAPRVQRLLRRQRKVVARL